MAKAMGIDIGARKRITMSELVRRVEGRPPKFQPAYLFSNGVVKYERVKAR